MQSEWLASAERRKELVDLAYWRAELLEASFIVEALPRTISGNLSAASEEPLVATNATRS